MGNTYVYIYYAQSEVLLKSSGQWIKDLCVSAAFCEAISEKRSSRLETEHIPSLIVLYLMLLSLTLRSKVMVFTIFMSIFGSLD